MSDRHAPIIKEYRRTNQDITLRRERIFRDGFIYDCYYLCYYTGWSRYYGSIPCVGYTPSPGEDLSQYDLHLHYDDHSARITFSPIPPPPPIFLPTNKTTRLPRTPINLAIMPRPPADNETIYSNAMRIGCLSYECYHFVRNIKSELTFIMICERTGLLPNLCVDLVIRFCLQIPEPDSLNR